MNHNFDDITSSDFDALNFTPEAAGEDDGRTAYRLEGPAVGTLALTATAGLQNGHDRHGAFR